MMTPTLNSAARISDAIQARELRKYRDKMSDKMSDDMSDDFAGQYYSEQLCLQRNQQCMRARCKFCGFLRAKNTTRQFEHLQQCNEFLNSSEGQQAIADGFSQQTPGEANVSGGRGDIFRGRAPNTNFVVNRPAGRPRQSGGPRPNVTPMPPAPAAPKPSLVNHLLAKNGMLVEQATQIQFLSHAGCGTLSTAALQQWLTQQGYISRSLCTFIGSLIGKIHLHDTKTPNQDTAWRTLDLLVSTMNNAKRELEFLRTTQAKYNLQSDDNPPKHATKGFIDIFASVSSPLASLLEGLVVLWAVEHVSYLNIRHCSTQFVD